MHDYNCNVLAKCSLILRQLHDRAGTFASLLYKAEKSSVCLSVRTFLTVSFSAMAAWIDVRLARRDSYVFWYDEVYF